jgi:hypothetical protein
VMRVRTDFDRCPFSYELVFGISHRFCERAFKECETGDDRKLMEAYLRDVLNKVGLTHSLCAFYGAVH